MLLPLHAQVRSRGAGSQSEFSRGYLEYRYHVPDLGLRLRISDNPLATEISGKKDLGLKNPRLSEFIFTYHGTGRSRFRAGYWQTELQADNALSRTVIFGDTVYPLSVHVESKLELRKFEAGYAFEAVRAGDGKFQLGPLVKLTGLLTKGKLSAPSMNLSAAEDLPMGIPTVGAALEIRPHPRLHISAEFSGIKIGKYGSALDGDISVRSRPAKYLAVGGGYRYFQATPRVDDDYLNVRLNGPYLSAGLAW